MQFRPESVLGPGLGGTVGSVSNLYFIFVGEGGAAWSGRHNLTCRVPTLRILLPIHATSCTGEMHLLLEWSLAVPFFGLMVQRYTKPSLGSPKEHSQRESRENARQWTPKVWSVRHASGEMVDSGAVEKMRIRGL